MVDVRVHLAAVPFETGDRIDAVFEAVVRSVQERGCEVVGYLQREISEGEGCCPATFLEDVRCGDRTRITQALGSGSRGCRLDPQALAEVAGRLLLRIEQGAGLLVLNRFGKGESEGHGFRPVIEKAVDCGIPVLTAVKSTYLEAWNAFGAGVATTIAPTPDDVLAWCLSVLPDAGAKAGFETADHHR